MNVPSKRSSKSIVVSPFYSKEDLAALFSVSIRTIEKWSAAGKLPAPRKVGRKWARWVKTEVDALIADVFGKGGVA